MEDDRSGAKLHQHQQWNTPENLFHSFKVKSEIRTLKRENRPNIFTEEKEKKKWTKERERRKKDCKRNILHVQT